MAILPSVQDLYDGALTIIEGHNGNLADKVTDETPGYVNPDAFLACIKAAGGTSEDRLKGFSYEDILQCLPQTNGVKPTVIAKEIAKVFRAKNNEVSSDKPRPVSNKKASRMTLEELVQNFDPEEPDSSIGERLNKMAKGQPFIVYEQGRDVDVDTTIKLLKEVRSLGHGRTVFQEKKVYIVGDLPNNYADENPLYPDRPLRPMDESCDQLNRSWSGVPHEVRQFVRFALDYTDGIENSPVRAAHDVLDMAISTDAMKKLRERYAEIAVEFDEARDQNELPKLKIALGSQPLEAAAGSPFDDGQPVQWMSGPPQANYYANSSNRADLARKMLRSDKKKR